MRTILICLIITTCTLNVLAQKPRPFIFNECALLANDAFPVSSDYALIGQIGLDVGAYHSYRLDRRLNPIFGVEYNLMRFSILDMYDDQSHSDVQCYYHLLKIPFSVRIFLDSKKQVFIEPGVYATAPVYNLYTVSSTVIEDGIAQEKQIKDHFASTPGAGFSFGLGAQLPLKKGALLVKGGGCWGRGSVVLGEGYTDESTILYSPGVRFGVIYQFSVRKNRLF